MIRGLILSCVYFITNGVRYVAIALQIYLNGGGGGGDVAGAGKVREQEVKLSMANHREYLYRKQF